jgi:hypothetical protein
MGKEKAQPAGETSAAAEAPPAQPVAPLTSGSAPAAQTATAPAQAWVAAPRRKMPDWVVAVLVAGGLIAAGALGFYLLQRSRTTSTAAASAPTQLEKPGTPAPAAKHRYAKYLDVTGIRVTEDGRRNLKVTFLVVNHSPAELAGIAANVSLRRSTSSPDEEPLTSFAFKLPALGPYESKEITVPAKTKLRAYELPDWQFLRADLEITSPQ